MGLFDKHIEMVRAVNEAATESEHRYNTIKLYGFREALIAMGFNQIIACDLYYMEQGIDRPMCGGVFLDWSAAPVDSVEDGKL